MAYQSLGLGTTEGDGTGDSIRVGGDKINDNFVEIYTLLGDGTTLTSGLSATTSVVTLATPSILGVASFADGSNSAPSITNTGDSNTGIYFSAADTVSVTTGGTKRVDIDSSGLDVTGAITATTSITATTTMQGTTITAETAFVPDASDGAALGTSSLEFSDLFLADGAVINLGDAQEVTLTHVADTGILLNGTMQLQFNDSSQYINAPSNAILDINAPSNAILDINATDEIELNATLADVNANLDVSGTYTGGGLMTTGGNIVIPNAGNIGSASDTDAIAIAANGVVTFSQIPVLPADSIDSDDLKTLSTLLIKNSGGSTLATFHCAGA